MMESYMESPLCPLTRFQKGYIFHRNQYWDITVRGQRAAVSRKKSKWPKLKTKSQVRLLQSKTFSIRIFSEKIVTYRSCASRGSSLLNKFSPRMHRTLINTDTKIVLRIFKQNDNADICVCVCVYTSNFKFNI